jgi:O-antigen/teichoic acid export membrane protein
VSAAPVSVNRKLLSGALGGLTFTAIGIGVSLLQFSILMRRLPLEIAGIWMVFTNIGGYIAFLDLGLSPTLGREISFAVGDPNLTEDARALRIGSLIHSCTVIVGMLAGVIVLVGAVGGWAYLQTIVPQELASATRPAWLIYIAGAAMSLLGEGWFAGIYGLGHVFSEKIIRSASSLLGLLFMTVAVLSNTGFMGLAIAYLLQSVGSLVMARIMIARLSPNVTKNGRFESRIVLTLVRPSLKYAATVLGGILILQTDNIVIASTLGPSTIPNYQAVAKIVTILMTLSMMLVSTSVPLISQAHARGDIDSILHLLSRSLRFGLSVIVILASFIASFTDRFIAAWLGPGHFVGFPVVWVLLGVMVLEMHHQAMGATTMATGRIPFLRPALLAGIINIAVSIVLARHYGLIGVVLGTMIAQVTTNNWYVPWYTMRLFHMSFARHLRYVVLPVIGLAVVMISIEAISRYLTRDLSNICSLMVAVFTTIVAGAFCFPAMVMKKSERNALKQKLSGIFRTGF